MAGELPTLHIQLLGDFRLVYDDVPVTTVNTPRVQALFAYLVLHRHAPQSRQRLAFLLWPDSTEAQARNNLRQCVYLLRQALPDADRFLDADTHTVQWLPDASFTLDMADFERSVEQSSSLTSLQQAVSLYRGELLPGCYDDWILSEREHLQKQFTVALEQLVAQLVSQHDYRSAIRCAERLLRSDPLREETYRQLIRLYCLSGHRTGALRVYRTCVRVLKRELGEEPSPETRAAYEESQNAESPPARTEALRQSRTNNLPTYLTDFIGRQQELEELKRLVLSKGTRVVKTRLLTLTGSGGCGKTRLAVQLATDVMNIFVDSVWLVDLAPLKDPTLIPQAIASVLDVQEQLRRTLMDTLLDYLQSKNLLLILDNCEHMIPQCAQLIELLLRSCPDLQVLATSRERLNVTGETVWRVPSLSLPDAHDLTPSILCRSDAVRLFVERAGAVLPTFALDTNNAAPIVQICHRLGGIPLAIELAAARVVMLTPAQIAARLDNVFQLLTQANRSAPLRHQTLGATMDWSYDLLAEKERILFRRLSVFVGGFTLEAVEAVCADPMERGGVSLSEMLGLLSGLVDKSLVMVIDWRQGEEARYRLLEPTWQYANEKLLQSGESERLRSRHLEFFLNLAEEAEPHFSQTEQVVWFDRLVLEHDNLRAAIDWSLQRTEPTAALRLTGALWYFWSARGYYTEGVRRLTQAVSRADEAMPSQARAKALRAAGALLLWSDSDGSQARPLLEKALAMGRKLGAKRIIAESLNTLGAVALGQKDYAAARLYLDESLALSRELGDKHNVGWSLAYLGDISLLQLNYKQAQRLFEESVSVFRGIGDSNSLAYPIRRLGQVAFYRDDGKQATALFKESLILNRQVGYTKGVAACLGALAGVAVRQRQPIRAARLFGAAEILLSVTAGKLFPTDQIEHDRDVAALQAQLDQVSLGAMWSEGRAMPLEQAIDYALNSEEH
jgi:non-specific serine/threonine protein kinase